MRENISPTKRALSAPSPGCRVSLLLLTSARTTTDPPPGDHRREENHGDVPVDVEEGHVEAREILGRYQRVLVDQQRGDGEHASPVEPPEPHDHAEQRECNDGEQ